MTKTKTNTTKQKTCAVTHAITKDSYPTMPHLATRYQIGDTITVKKEYFYNGECHIKGYLNNTNEIVDLPTVWTNLY